MRTIKSTALSLLLVAISTVAALAHAKMNASVPKDGAIVPAGLSEIELSFSKPLRLTLVHVVRATERKEVPVTSELPKSFVNSAKLTVEALLAGPYEVSWTAVADDGHVMNGSFKFSVGEAKHAQPAQ
jgi:methionine-rich copper-binding protein CopC